MDPARNSSGLEATGVSENDVQLLMPVSEEKLVVPTMAGFGTPEVPLDGSRFEAYRFPAPTCHEHADPFAPRPEPSGSSMTTADLAKAMEVLTLLNQSGRLQQMVRDIEHHDGSFTHAHRLMSRGSHCLRVILSTPRPGVLCDLRHCTSTAYPWRTYCAWSAYRSS